ncbi:MAG TPA: hypothetical protein VEU08_20635 [Vicinamibacterales bacterium]|nr:hypothetical protein [Vicinamibacterales bacterium]
MPFIKFVLFVFGAGLVTAAAAIVVIDAAARSAVSRASGPFNIRWPRVVQLAAAGR